MGMCMICIGPYCQATTKAFLLNWSSSEASALFSSRTDAIAASP